MVVGALPTGSLTSCNGQSSESDVVHDHVRPRQHEIGAVARVGVLFRARHVEHAGATQRGETVGCASRGGELSTAGSLTEMITDSRSDADGEVLVEGVSENLLPTAQP